MVVKATFREFHTTPSGLIVAGDVVRVRSRKVAVQEEMDAFLEESVPPGVDPKDVIVIVTTTSP